MRIKVPYEDKTCFDCPFASEKGKFLVNCKRKGISVYASNQKYMECKYEQARERVRNMKNLQLKIIAHYGLENQKTKLKEEMTELAYARDDENFIEEMADVLNVIQGIIAFMGCEEQVTKIQLEKLQRQELRIEEENKIKLEV